MLLQFRTKRNVNGHCAYLALDTEKYAEFKKNYNWMLKKYPDTSSAFDIDDFCTVETIHQVKNGNKWLEAEPSTTEKISGEYYANTVDAVPFFRNLGGTEKVTKAYTKRGLIPVEIVSVSPDRQIKTIRRFTFDK